MTWYGRPLKLDELMTSVPWRTWCVEPKLAQEIQKIRNARVITDFSSFSTPHHDELAGVDFSWSQLICG
jgi:hypothetical protein